MSRAETVRVEEAHASREKGESPLTRADYLLSGTERLAQEHRDVLRECYFRGSSVAQAAHALGIAPGTVKSRAAARNRHPGQ